MTNTATIPEVTAYRITVGKKHPVAKVDVYVDHVRIKRLGGDRAHRCNFAIVVGPSIFRDNTVPYVYGLRSSLFDANKEASQASQYYQWTKVVEIETGR